MPGVARHSTAAEIMAARLTRLKGRFIFHASIELRIIARLPVTCRFR
jgi:hypothetical protein